MIDIESLVKYFDDSDDGLMALERRLSDRVEPYTIGEILLEFEREIRYGGINRIIKNGRCD